MNFFFFIVFGVCKEINNNNELKIELIMLIFFKYGFILV